MRTAGAGSSNPTELPALGFADPESVAVSQEGRAVSAPPGGGAGSEDRGHLARRDPCLDKARGLYQGLHACAGRRANTARLDISKDQRSEVTQGLRMVSPDVV